MDNPGKLSTFTPPYPSEISTFEPPHPLGISFDHPWGVWIFSGTTQCRQGIRDLIKFVFLLGSIMGISRIFDPKLSWKLVVANFKSTQDIFFEHLKEDISLICKRKQITIINIDYLKTSRNTLKSLASIFQLTIHFDPHHLQPKTLTSFSSFSALIEQLLTKIGHYL